MGTERIAAIPASAPASDENPAQLLLEIMRAGTGSSDTDYDEDGDIGVRYGDLVVFASIVGDPPHVHAYALLVEEIESEGAALVRLNELNKAAVMASFFLHEGSIYACASVPARPFVKEVVQSAVDEFCEVADAIGQLLRAEFGGETDADDAEPAPVLH